MILKTITLIASLFISQLFFCQGQQIKTIEFLNFIKGKDSLVDMVLNNHKKYKLQIIYSQITHLTKDSVEITNSALLDHNYFYPASTIKLPCAMLALEKLNELKIEQDHYFKIDNEFLCGNSAHIHNSQNLKTSFYDIIRKMIVVSHNASYNSVYEFLTPGYIQKKLKSKSLKNTHIYKKFSGCNIADNLKCNTIKFYNTNNRLLYTQKASVLDLLEMAKNYKYDYDNLIGTYTYKNKKTSKKPYDFNYNISASLEDLHNSLINLIYPSTINSSQQWNLKQSDKNYLIKLLGMFPRELNNKLYQDSTLYPDHLLKHIVFGESNAKNKLNHIRSFSKIGLSYGFTTEVAYVVDLDKKIDFFLSISIYTNNNKTINDGIYEYEQISKPFFARLGKLLLEYEVQRNQPFKPDFSELNSLYN